MEITYELVAVALINLLLQIFFLVCVYCYCWHSLLKLYSILPCAAPGNDGTWTTGGEN